MTTTVGSATRIGTLTISEPREARINSEYAAWWTDVVLRPGMYDLFMWEPDRVSARIPATIDHESNAPHFGGVPFGPSTQTRTGQETTYFWSMYAHALADALVEGKALGGDEITLAEGVEARRIDFERWMPCGEAMGYGYEKDESGTRIETHSHYRRWSNGWDDGLVRGAARDAAYDDVKACPESKMVWSHTYGFVVNGERVR